MRLFRLLITCTLVTLAWSASAAEPPPERREPSVAAKPTPLKSAPSAAERLTSEREPQFQAHVGSNGWEVYDLRSEPWWREAEAWTAIGTVALAFFTALLWIYTYKLWRGAEEAARKQEQTTGRQEVSTQEALKISRETAEAARAGVDLTRRAMESGQRAFLFCKAVLPLPLLLPDGAAAGLAFYGQIMNTGSTPAMATRLAIMSKRSDKGTRPPFEVPWIGGSSVLPPRGEARTARVDLLMADLNDAYAGRCDLHVYVRVEYQDVFDPDSRHHHEVCVRVSLTHDPAKLSAQELPQYVALYADGDQNSAA